MTTCQEHRGDLAVRALGLPAADRDDVLDDHLAGCPDCRAELDELEAVAGALALAEPEALRGPQADASLADRIVERWAAERAAGRTRARRRMATVAAAAVVLAVAAVLAVGALAGDDGGDDDGRRIELAGEPGVAGSVELTPRAWGTEVHLEVSGLHEGDVYWLWLTGEDGERVAAGTIAGTGRPARAVLASAMPTEEARRVWMTDGDDTVVLDAVLDTPPTTGS